MNGKGGNIEVPLLSPALGLQFSSTTCHVNWHMESVEGNSETDPRTENQNWGNLTYAIYKLLAVKPACNSRGSERKEKLFKALIASKTLMV